MEFREFVRQCGDNGSLAVVGEPCACASVPARVAREERGPNRALLFDRIVDADAKIVGNLFGSSERLCQAASVPDQAQLCAQIEHAIERPLAVGRSVPRGKEYTLRRNPDLRCLLPQIRYSGGDAAPYLTSGIAIARDASYARLHACYVRLQVLGGNRLLFNPATPRIRQIVDATVGCGQALDIAVAFGAPVELTLMACVSVAAHVDKLEVAQALAGGGLAFAGEKVPAPLSTEYVLTGQVVPEYQREGPFGDLKGLYTMNDANPTFRVDELWERRDALFHSISAGISREHVELVTLGPRLHLERLKRRVPGILRYDIPAFGGGRFAVLVLKGGFKPDALIETLSTVPIIRGFAFINEDVASDSAADLVWAMLQRSPDSACFRVADQAHEVFREKKLFIDTTVDDPYCWEHRRVELCDAA